MLSQIGSAKVGADITIPANTIQNGPDAIALYRSESPPSKQNQAIPRDGLLDAIVYRARGSDKNIAELTKALTPGQRPLLEDINASPGDESLSRCGTDRFNLSAYRVRSSFRSESWWCHKVCEHSPSKSTGFCSHA